MSELLNRVLSLVNGKISLRKLMLWFIVFILLWCLTPDRLIEFFSSKNFSFLPDNSLFGILCIAVSYLLIDFSSGIFESFFKNKKASKRKKKVMNNINALSRDELDIILQFVFSGRQRLTFQPDDENIIKLTASGVLIQTYGLNSYRGCTYMLNSCYREVALELISVELQNKDIPE